MNYAIIAAGEGSRLVEEGIESPKPLVCLNGVPLIDRLTSIFLKNNAETISIIVNNEMPDVRAHVKKMRLDVPLNIVVQSTPSSMHSFYALMPFLQKDKFCLTTIDTIFKEEEFASFIRAFAEDQDHDGMMAVTDYIDDEKPLYVDVDRTSWMINDFLDATDDQRYVSGGIYGLSSRALATLQYCMERGMSRMRNYQRQLVADGLQLKAYPFKKIIDIDHAGDIEKAALFLNENK
ncbi:MAG: NDP-sugar synthase [Dysgonamonadaceae bacterium]|nr:NDP-sugar synthase [Dysgonamonadaceae bacterium]